MRVGVKVGSRVGAKILYQSYPRMFRAHPGRFLFHVLLIPALGYGLFLLVRWWLQNYSQRLKITERLVIYEVGIFDVTDTEIRISDIRTVRIERTFMERLLGTGTIMISSAGADGYEIDLKGMPNPRKVRELIDAHRGASGSTTD
jgi:uncharacterized membrane protein YdbT with pleckstrin-like domain